MALSASYDLRARFSLGSLVSRLGAYRLLLVICLIQFSSAWYWGGVTSAETGGEISAPLQVPFRYLTWLSIAGCGAVYLYTRSHKTFLQVLAPLLPFILIGVLATPLGHSITLSTRSLIFWTLMAFGATTAGLMLSPRQTLTTVYWTLLTLVAGSLVMSLLVPSVGTQPYVYETVWKGLFQSKNHLGITSMWALAIAYFCIPTLGWFRSGLLAALSTVCLIMSGSAGSLVVSIAALGYFALLAMLIRARISTALGAGLLIGTVLALVVAAIVLFVPVTTALGRDPTLTGRTEIWALYLSEMPGHWLLGHGPGAFYFGSTISDRLYEMLLPLGQIHQPHSAYIMALGEGGIPGLVAYVGGLFYIAFVAPFRMRTPESLASALGGFLVIMGGIAEGRGVYSTGLEGFLLLLFRSLAVRSVLPGYVYGRRTL